jgi:hypothetical protein
MYPIVRKDRVIGIPIQEPEELLDDPPPEDAFGGEEGEPVAQIKAKCSPEEGERTGPSSFARSSFAVANDIANQVEVLVLWMRGHFEMHSGRRESV